MYKLTSVSKSHQLTKAVATTFAEMAGAPRDRALSERRIQIYSKLVERGMFRPLTWAKCYCKETETTYRVNGKHTSNLFAYHANIPNGQLISIEEYCAETLEDVARLYSTYDGKVASRTTNDVNGSFAGTLPELAEIPSRIISLVVSGLAYYLWSDSYSSSAHSPEDRAELLLDQSSFALFCYDLFSGKNSKPMQKLCVVGAIFGTWKKSQKACHDFWHQVRDEVAKSQRNFSSAVCDLPELNPLQEKY